MNTIELTAEMGAKVPAKVNNGTLELSKGAHIVRARIKVLGVKQRTIKREEGTNGGITTKVREIERDYVDAEYKTACTLADRLRGIVRRAVVNTPIGALTDEDRARALQAALQVASTDVKQWNKQARTHKVRCEALVVPIGPSLDGVADSMADTVRTALYAMRESLLTGDPVKVRAVLQRWHNLDALMIGMMRDAVRDTMNALRKANNTMKARLKNGESVAQIAKHPEDVPEIEGTEQMLLSLAPEAEVDTDL
ncbi:hypothetical protein [Caudoviricetes sp.]|nr:hypothetical protein [Caudoviricetes sp.]